MEPVRPPTDGRCGLPQSTLSLSPAGPVGFPTVRWPPTRQPPPLCGSRPPPHLDSLRFQRVMLELACPTSTQCPPGGSGRSNPLTTLPRFPHAGTSGDAPSSARSPWATRWSRLARPLDLGSQVPVAVALSGGADSVFLLHAIARADTRPKVLAIHVDHGLRGEESQADAEFCARLCARLGIPFARRTVELDADGPDLEARAREARYRALADEAVSAGFDVLLTGHHEDDAVETLLMRWMRGTELSGLAGLRRETVLGSGHTGSERSLRVLRPLMGMRREEVRSALRRESLEWREDSSNESERFTRNRVRAQVLPKIAAECGDEGVENFKEFARAIESFEEELADRTAHIAWQPVAFEAARRSASAPDLGGRVPRTELESLSPPLLRRALGRLIGEGTGRRPSKDVLSQLSDTLFNGDTGRTELQEGWTVQLQSDALHLTPPSGSLGPVTSGGSAQSAVLEAPSQVAQAQARPAQAGTTQAGTAMQRTSRRDSTGALAADRESERAEAVHPAPAVAASSAAAQPIGSAAAAPISGTGLSLGLPGAVHLPDGRSISAELVTAPSTSVGSDLTTVELDATGLGPLSVRFCRPGDRFKALGAPGHKAVRRYLGELGIPREERDRVPMVVDGDEIIWIAGVQLADSRRVTDGTKRRVRLALEGVRDRS